MKRIKEVCELSGVTKRTLQYYDDEGLLIAGRSSGNERVYDDDALNRLWEIMMFKQMRFRLEEIQAIINLPGSEQKVMLKKHIETMKVEAAELERQIEISETVHQHGMPPVCCVCESAATYQECIDVLKFILDNKEIVSNISNTGKVMLNGRYYTLNTEFAEWLGLDIKSTLDEV